MNLGDLKPGVIVRGPVLPEPIEVLVVTPLGDVIKLTGAGQRTGMVHQRVLHAEQLALLEATPEHGPFNGDPARFRLGIEAARLGLAYEYDPYFSLSIARVDPLPHQLEAVYDYFMRIPRIRFIEVKGRAGVGQVALSSNEYKTAERLRQDYWLYVVFHCGATPELHAVQDPARLGWQPVVQVAHYQVGPDAIVAAASTAGGG